MTLPNNTLHTNLVSKQSFLSPDAHQRVSKLYDYERGGVALNNSSQGINDWDWKIWYDKSSGNVIIARLPELEEIVLFTRNSVLYNNLYHDITSLSLSFDQNMRPTVAYMEQGICKLYWYDSVLQTSVHTTFTNATNPLLTMDDKRYGADTYNDILFFYVKDGYLSYRQQRDRYLIERILQEIPTGEIIQVGMCRDLRLRVVYKIIPKGDVQRKHPCMENKLVSCVG